MNLLERLQKAVYQTLIQGDRWRFYATGFLNTLRMASIACIIGIAIGTMVALVKVAHASSQKAPARSNLAPLLGAANWLANLYTTITRGTPVLLQLLIIYFVVFATAPPSSAVYIASLAFGVNSGAYVSEIIRAGIQSLDKGQTEAGRSLGLSQGQTMRLIVLPQAIRNILPTLFNEFIALLKETSVAGYIAIDEITRAGDVVRSRTYGFAPLFVSAFLYLSLVIALTKVQAVLERRFGANDSRA
jgi:amine acid ABC transporter, permease protein, 3-TM region, His/Glu/Gln/Arg/opine family